MTHIRCPASRRRSALSLIEVLLAVAILASAAGGMLAVRANAMHTGMRARNEEIASMLAARALDEAALGRPSSRIEADAAADHPGFVCRLRIEEIELGPMGKARRLRVEVSYPIEGNDADARDTLALETFLVSAGK